MSSCILQCGSGDLQATSQPCYCVPGPRTAACIRIHVTSIISWRLGSKSVPSTGLVDIVLAYCNEEGLGCKDSRSGVVSHCKFPVCWMCWILCMILIMHCSIAKTGVHWRKRQSNLLSLMTRTCNGCRWPCRDGWKDSWPQHWELAGQVFSLSILVPL